MKWAMEFAPPMPSQLVGTLNGLAYHADKRGRGAYPSTARLSALACKDKRSVQRDLKALKELGLIRLGNQALAAHLPEGKRPEVYDLAMERVVPGGRAGTDEVTRTSRVTLASSRRRGGKKKASSDDSPPDLRGDADVTPDVDVTRDADVADGVTWTSQEGRRGRHPNLKDEPSVEPKDMSVVRAVANDEADASERDYAMDKFGAFSLVYPKRRSMEKAKTAWCAAIDRGVDPQHIVDAATSYARERAGQDAKYTKYPDRWLNDGCYDDEPDPQPASKPHLKAVGGKGGHRPFQPPKDHSVYANGFRS